MHIDASFDDATYVRLFCRSVQECNEEMIQSVIISHGKCKRNANCINLVLVVLTTVIRSIMQCMLQVSEYLRR